MDSETFPIPEKFANSQTHIKGLDHYRLLYAESINSPETFWAKAGNEQLSWFSPPSKAFEGNFHTGDTRWFVNGQLNASYNCIDRHIDQRGDKVAIIWEGDEPDQIRHITYKELLNMVCRIANALKTKGVRKGDRVAIYMPMVPEATAAMLACARIGAPHVVVFAGFSAEALRQRVVDSGANVVITANQGSRAGKVIGLKTILDEALLGTDVKTVFVYDHAAEGRQSIKIPWHPTRDVWLHEAMAAERPYCPPVWVDSEDPLFFLHTSGSTGKPKGLMHTTAGYLVYASLSHKYAFDVQENDVYACMADVGWITGHSYIVYAPLVNGSTTLMFESIPTYPTASRYWEMVDRHKITIFYTSPTALRSLMRFGTDPIKSSSLASLRVLGTVGEPINPEAWRWYYNEIGKQKCAIVDTYWQTESGGFLLVPLPGAIPTKPGSATLPFFGVEAAVLEPKSGIEITDTSATGVLVVKKPWPGIARSIFGDHERFMTTYFKQYAGQYFTGDGCIRDADGYYWITGRIDDVINKSGHRIGTAEVESAIVSHPGCTEAAVVGVNDEIRGQKIVAFCTVGHGYEHIKDATLITEFKGEVRKHIGGLAVPDVVILTSALPKTRSGKIMRRILRKVAEGEKEFGDISTLAEPKVVEELIQKVAEALASSSG